MSENEDWLTPTQARNRTCSIAIERVKNKITEADSEIQEFFLKKEKPSMKEIIKATETTGWIGLALRAVKQHCINDRDVTTIPILKKEYDEVDKDYMKLTGVAEGMGVTFADIDIKDLVEE